MPQTAQCPGCQRWVQAPDQVVGRLRCPHCAAAVQGDQLAWQPVLLWVPEEAVQITETDSTANATDDDAKQASNVLSDGTVVSIRPAVSSGTSTKLASRRSGGRKTRPVVEFAKVVAGGLAGVAIAQGILWWLPGNWRRDPFQLAPHIPAALQFILPAELRPLPLPLPLDFVPSGTADDPSSFSDWDYPEQTAGDSNGVDNSERSSLGPVTGLENQAAANAAADASAESDSASASTAPLEGQPQSSASPTIDQPKPEPLTPHSDPVSTPESKPESPLVPIDSSQKSEVAPPGAATPSADPLAPSPPPTQGTDHRAVLPQRAFVHHSLDFNTAYTTHIQVPNTTAFRVGVTRAKVSVNRRIPEEAQAVLSRIGPQHTAVDRLRSDWKEASASLDQYESGLLLVPHPAERMRRMQRIENSFRCVAETVGQVKGDERPDAGALLNEVAGLLARLSDHPEWIQRFAMGSGGLFSVLSDADRELNEPNDRARGVVLVGRVGSVRKSIVAPGYEVELEMPAAGSCACTLLTPVAPRLDARQPFHEGSWLLVLGVLELGPPKRESVSDTDPTAFPGCRVQVTLHQVLFVGSDGSDGTAESVGITSAPFCPLPTT